MVENEREPSNSFFNRSISIHVRTKYIYYVRTYVGIVGKYYAVCVNLQ